MSDSHLLPIPGNRDIRPSHSFQSSIGSTLQPPIIELIAPDNCWFNFLQTSCASVDTSTIGTAKVHKLSCCCDRSGIAP